MRAPLAAIATLLFAGAVFAQTGKGTVETGSSKVGAADKQFFDYAAEDNQAEIALCILAEKKARAPAIKAFARLMVSDHAGIESRLAALIDAEGVEVPTGRGKEGRETFSKLEALQGEAFDREFIKAQIEDHSKDLEKFERQRTATKLEGARQYAGETLPILQQHLQLARAIQAAMISGGTAK